MTDLQSSGPNTLAEFGEAWPWEVIEDDCRKYEAPLLLALVKEIRRRGLDARMFGAIGVEGLYLCMSRTWARNGDVLRVSEDAGKVRLTYLASAQTNTSSDYAWDYRYPAEEAWSAFERFLVRAHWLAKDHPIFAQTDA